MSKTEPKAKRLFKNGNRWWLRVNTPTPGVYARLSTGTAELKVANRVASMMATFTAEHTHTDLVRAATDGRIALMRLYDAFAAGTLTELRAELAKRAIADPDIEPLVARWVTEHLAGRTLEPLTIVNYTKQVRALVPAGRVFPASRVTEDVLHAALLALPVSDSTKRRYAAAWRLFIRYVRRRLPGAIPSDPFEFATEWLPKNGPNRTTFWSHRTTLKVLDRMSGEPRRAMALIFGTGMELAAIRNLACAHILDHRTLIAPGTKNAHRRDRTILCDAWAWEIFYPNTRLSGIANKRVFDFSDNELRDAFYTAQVDAGLIPMPARSVNGKPLWRSVRPHRVHDARHTYSIVRLLGTDGEPKRTAKFIAHQLGHADETMLSRVYAKANVEARHDLALAEMEMDAKPMSLEIAK